MKRTSSCLIVLFVALFGVTMAVDYCQIPSCATRSSHTMCKYKSPNPSSACGKVSSNTLSQAEKDELVKAHNTLRKRVASGQEKRGNPGPQPRASDMQTITWDEELAKIAQRWVNQCIFQHDQCRNTQKGAVGQNLGIKYTTGKADFTMSSFVQSWYDEVKDFDRNQVPKFTGKDFAKVGHYTQVVWAKTNKIGCGSIAYEKDGWNTRYVACNYEPSGNWIGEPVYTTAK